MEQKLCINCKHSRRDWIWNLMIFDTEAYQFDKCHRKATIRNSPINGKPEIVEVNYCSCERMQSTFTDVCGPEGKYYQEKEKFQWHFLNELKALLKTKLG